MFCSPRPCSFGHGGKEHGEASASGLRFVTRGTRAPAATGNRRPRRSRRRRHHRSARLAAPPLRSRAAGRRRAACPMPARPATATSIFKHHASDCVETPRQAPTVSWRGRGSRQRERESESESAQRQRAHFVVHVLRGPPKWVATATATLVSVAQRGGVRGQQVKSQLQSFPT